MKISADAWYSILSFRKRSIGVVLVANSREWGRAQLLEPLPKNVHPAAAQFIRSTLGSLHKRLEASDVPSRRDLEYLSRKLRDEVRLTAPLPISGADPDALVKRLLRSYTEEAA